MQLEAFKFREVRVRGIAGVHSEERCYPTGSGIFEVPEDEGYSLKEMRIRDPRDGSYIRYLAPEDVEESLRLGTLEHVEPRTAPTPAPAKAKGKVTSSDDDE